MAAGKPEAAGGEAGGTDRDAIGNDKRRRVVGRQYGVTARKRVLFYGVTVLVIMLVAVAFLTVIRSVDERDIALEPTAPWTEADAPAIPPRPIDFMRNGPEDTIPRDQITDPPVVSESP
jgi:hypothetical protein